MGKIIPFHRPTVKLKTPLGPTQINKAEFDAQVAEEEVVSAKTVLEEAIKGADLFEEIIVMIQGKDGTIGLISNLETFAERLALLERVKAQMVQQDALMSGHPTGGPESA